MKFGRTATPELIDFSLPEDHPDTAKALAEGKGKARFEIHVGCAKWNRNDLKGFYPRGTKDELSYYARQFNAIELNATFYHSPTVEQVEIWKNKTPENFKFYPKIPATVSHYKRLLNVKQPVTDFCKSIRHFDDRLGMTFLQLHDNFKPDGYGRLEKFIKEYPEDIPLAVELRNQKWFNKSKEGEQFFKLLRQEKRTPVLVDTAGRRDLLHMRLTTPTAFIRYVGANHATDYTRLDDWLERIKKWRKEGLQKLHFFVHQNMEKESPLLSAYFIRKLNETFELTLKVPQSATSGDLLF